MSRGRLGRKPGEGERVLVGRAHGDVAAAFAAPSARAREFVRIALHDRPGLGQGAGPIGQGNVRLDVGAGPRLNQVTITGSDYARAVDFYRRLGLKQIVDSPDNG